MKRIGQAAMAAVTALVVVGLGAVPAQAYDITGKSADDLQVRNLRVVSVTGIVMQVDNTNVYAQADDLNKIHNITATAAAVNQAAVMSGGATAVGTNFTTLRASGAATLQSTLNVAGASTLTGAVTTVGNVAAGSFSTTGTLHGGLAATFDNTLNVAGAVTFTNTASTHNIDVAGSVTVTTNINLSGAAHAVGLITANAFAVSNAAYGGLLTGLTGVYTQEVNVGGANAITNVYARGILISHSP